ncbi:hypothetical protein SAMN00768000_3732 [Sulfobacillus thermosulfidooxidans DSM 9293]|uniref:Uncharacterized protein n=1 Tax=Sulfobacillus thermosulfidooxidans (strain DSM 9293 / VKM B-1269 / AT-1) TaxID=929705 RepID=A0A1W1WR39_SULTA|nr:hypothetical protein [Sulfobacillus thermosulfidooxidans]SMC08193.1 hypothetical protein SAMN00768000_3732 [Sulfobacillus thermosulfidooxidans DSM 9293]
MSSPPFPNLSSQSWELLRPHAKPFVSVIRTLIAREPATHELWHALRHDLSTQPEQWLVRLNWWAVQSGYPGFTRHDWDRLSQLATTTADWSWASIVPALILLALIDP